MPGGVTGQCVFLRHDIPIDIEVSR